MNQTIDNIKPNFEPKTSNITGEDPWDTFMETVPLVNHLEGGEEVKVGPILVTQTAQELGEVAVPMVIDTKKYPKPTFKIEQ